MGEVEFEGMWRNGGGGGSWCLLCGVKGFFISMRVLEVMDLGEIWVEFVGRDE